MKWNDVNFLKTGRLVDMKNKWNNLQKKEKILLIVLSWLIWLMLSSVISVYVNDTFGYVLSLIGGFAHGRQIGRTFERR